MRFLHALPAALLAAAAAALAFDPSAYENTQVQRTYELGGAATSVQTVYTVRALKENPGDYELVLASPENDVAGGSDYWEVVQGRKVWESLTVQSRSDGQKTVTIPLDTTATGGPITFTLSQILVHQSYPLPASIGQDDEQFLMFESNATMVESLYSTKKETIKYRSPSKKIISHSPAPEKYVQVGGNASKKSGGTLTLGPYTSVPRTVSLSGAGSLVREPGFNMSAIRIHYPYEEPVKTIEKLTRLAEVSHWGDNLNVEDHIRLVNTGAHLKGQFSRIQYQMARFRPTFPAQIIRNIIYPLPPNSHSAYYYDVIGNISTSNFRPSHPTRGGPALLELRPRYPILGGWMDEFVVGWDMKLGDWLKSVKGHAEHKVLRVPFMTALPGVVVDEAELVITLPEGARNVNVTVPFPVDTIEQETHKTYLDSIGRPRITIKKRMCVEKHEQDVYVTYTYPFRAQFQKVFTVGIATATFFAALALAKRVDVRISKVPQQLQVVG
ncbi:hypothetical protein QFC19_001554 [Naganishia cerealis]|uniref:Uncharacterized protein n=1 Tax=Naganishia cerealis TaxID=610337 RepID=A0ACC2WGZ7_9TREE|nr:hypothetical protein QFC19_001554 [Naganishia cerealis]